jgi:hypothetical protein
LKETQSIERTMDFIVDILCGDTDPYKEYEAIGPQ